MIETLVLANGKVWTGDAFATNVVICGGRIQSIDGAAPFGARVIDLRGRLVVPGFIDNHLHFVMGSLQLTRVQLRDATSLDTFVHRIAEHARGLAAGKWITGGGWDEQRWSPPVVPTKADLDAVAAGHPVFVTRLDLHMGVANSIALRLAGITRDAPDPQGGAIGRDAGGEPNGVLKDAAMSLMTSVIPPPTHAERLDAMRLGLAEAARFGVTSFCDMGMTLEAFDDFRAYQHLDRQEQLTARAWMYFPIGEWQRVAALGIEKGFGSARLRIGGLKGFSDGSLGSSTAAFYDPYEGEPHNRGLLMQSMLDGSMRNAIAAADAQELQLAIHAIGDRASDEVLKIFESLDPARDKRFRIEHAQHLDPSLIRRFAKANVIAAAQPFHAADDGRWAHARIGKSRMAWAFPFRSLTDGGVRLTFGSDWPVAPLDPLAGIDAAVNRRTIDGLHPDGWIPEQKISVLEALHSYTSRSASAVFAGHEIGTIAEGMRADLVVLSDDLFAIDPLQIGRVRVQMTIFDGRVIYEA